MSATLSLSLELVSLLEWLLKNKKETMQTFVKESVEQGLVTDNSFEDANPETIALYVHKVVMGLLEFLEESLVEKLGDDDKDNGGINKQFAMTIEHLDQSSFDPDVVWLSVQQAKSALLREGSNEAREALLKKLLKNWHAHGEEALC
ncbi:hypothetical protein KAU11_03625 [Candidatus Babeliales bacterium]|nr:hypothetical protein [Candidatus Babeliales bacterium]